MANKIILLLTATQIETLCVLDAFSIPTKDLKREHKNHRLYYFLGKIADTKIILVQSEAGTSTLGGSQSTVTKSIAAFPQDVIVAIIMIGIAFGTDPEKQELCNILISEHLKAYEPGKIKGEFISRGDRMTIAPGLLGIFRSGEIDWQRAKRKVKIQFGLIVSGEKLVADIEFRKWLVKHEPEAIGGDMESVGLYVVGQEEKVDWIVVKGISDWGDGNKNNKAQRRAARNAATFVLYVLQKVWFREDVIRNVSNILKSVEDRFIQTDIEESDVRAYRKKILTQIQEPFIYQLEKELIEHMYKYFPSPESDIRKSDNYLAILYFSHEMQEVNNSYADITALYVQRQPKNLSDRLIQVIKDKLSALEKHTKQTSDLINVVLGKKFDPLGQSIDESLNKITTYLGKARIALLQNNITQLWRVFLKLRLELEIYRRCLEEMNKYLQDCLMQKK